MTMAEIVALIPEEKRAAVQAELDGAVKIASREDAERLIRDNAHVRAAFDAGISKTVADHDQRFMAEKLPGLVDEGIKARMPKPKDPELAAALERVEKLERENREASDKALRAQQRARAIGKLAEKGLSDKMAEYVLGSTDEETDAKLAAFIAEAEAWRNSAVEGTIKDRFGTQPMPAKGTAPEPQDLESLYQKAVADGNADLALHYQGKLQARGPRK